MAVPDPLCKIIELDGFFRRRGQGTEYHIAAIVDVRQLSGGVRALIRVTLFFRTRITEIGM